MFKIGDIVKVIDGKDMSLRDKIGRVLYVCDDKNMVVVKFTIIDQTRLGSKITQVRWLKCDDLKLAKHPELYVKVVLQSCQVKEIPQNFIDRLSKEDLMHFAYDADIFDYDEPNIRRLKMANYLEKIVRLSGENVGVTFYFDQPTSAQVDTKELLDGIGEVRFDYTGVSSLDYVYQSTNRIKAYVDIYTKDTTLPTLMKVEFLKGSATVIVTVKDALIALADTFDLDPKEIGLLPTGNPFLCYLLDKETHSVCCNDLSNHTTFRKELTEQQFVVAAELVRIYELMLDFHKQSIE